MKQVLLGIPNVVCYLDDILITDNNEVVHLQNLTAVFERLCNCGLRLKKSKCQFLESEVDYLGYRISSEGLRTSQSKVKAVLDAPTPRNLTELKSFLGLVNYYARFLPSLAEVCHPLNNL